MQSGAPSVAFQAASSMFSAVAQSNQLRGAEAVDRENANLAELEGALQQTDIHRRGRAVQGEAIAAGAANTGSIEGSARDLLMQNSVDIEMAALNAKFAAANEARGYRMQAAQHKAAARNAIFAGILGAGAAAIGGIERAQGAASEDAAYQRQYDAYFPGGQRLPMPDGTAPPSFIGPR